jgi:hypothetical protein|tara:strand:+ start:46 stop:363 length:318 start_codon:yes stop_codon:yes gene_type:complete
MPEESVLTEKLNEKQSEVKFTEEELKQIQNIQKSYANITSQLGQVSIAKIRLQEQELSLAKEDEKIQEKFRNVQQEEQKFLDGITKKYGQGSLNPETGVFTPDKS